MKTNDYIHGARHGREAHDLELEAMRDPLLGDALDGFDAVPGDHSAALGRLAKRVHGSAAAGRAAARSRAARLRERRIRGWSIAAAAVFLAGIVGGGVLLLRDGVPSNANRGTIASRIDRSGYGRGEVEAILPPVTVIEEEAAPIPPTDMSNLKLDSDEVRDFSDAIAPSPAPQAQAQAQANERAQAEPATQIQAEIPASEVQAQVDVSVEEAALDEVVVVGYGTQKRSALTGSATLEESRSDIQVASSADSIFPSDTTTTAAFRRYIYERTIVRSAVLGAVMLYFEVDADGRPKNINIVAAPADFPEAANAAIELLEQGPDWPTEQAYKLITINL